MPLPVSKRQRTATGAGVNLGCNVTNTLVRGYNLLHKVKSEPNWTRQEHCGTTACGADDDETRARGVVCSSAHKGEALHRGAAIARADGGLAGLAGDDA